MQQCLVVVTDHSSEKGKFISGWTQAKTTETSGQKRVCWCCEHMLPNPEGPSRQDYGTSPPRKWGVCWLDPSSALVSWVGNQVQGLLRRQKKKNQNTTMIWGELVVPGILQHRSQYLQNSSKITQSRTEEQSRTVTDSLVQLPISSFNKYLQHLGGTNHCSRWPQITPCPHLHRL
jgi:hypothetical protein